jgi:hypothetical protein
MSFFEEVVWLGKQAFSGMMFYKLATFLLGLNLLFSMLINVAFNAGKYGIKHFAVFSPFLITFAILIIGVLMGHDETSSATKWPQYAIYIFGILHIPVAIYLIYMMKDLRWFAISISLFQMWCSLWAAFVALMAVTGDWL